MKGETHFLIGANTAWLFTLFESHIIAINPLVLPIMGGFTALLPDLDAEHSKIKYIKLKDVQLFAPFAELTSRAFGHRGFLHSFLACLIFTLLIGILAAIFRISWLVPLAAFFGYLSHLVADTLSGKGIPWLYPNRRRFVILSKLRRYNSGLPDSLSSHFLEELIFWLSAFGLLLFLFRYELYELIA